ncbi:MAG: hypothetical protein ACQEXJ_18395 [Myxococcota bacterium]
MNARTAFTLLGALAATTLAAGCESSITGEEGNLEFSYTTVEETRDFNKPVAVGAKLDVRVKEAGTNLSVDLSSVSSRSPGVLRVDGFSGNTMTLEGTGNGNSRIEVRARRQSGDRVTDAVTMLAREPEVLKLDHHCADTARAAYLVDTEVWLPFDMELDSGKALVGYGYYPVDAEPPDALTLPQDSKDQENIRATTWSQPGLVTLRSRVDDASLELDLVEEGDIDGAVRQTRLTDEVLEGTFTTVRVVPTVGEERLCCPKVDMEVETTTTDICQVTVIDEDGTCLSSGFLRVQGDALGTCEWTITYPNAAGGDGVSVDGFSMEVVDTLAP